MAVAHRKGSRVVRPGAFWLPGLTPRVEIAFHRRGRAHPAPKRGLAAQCGRSTESAVRLPLALSPGHGEQWPGTRPDEMSRSGIAVASACRVPMCFPFRSPRNAARSNFPRGLSDGRWADFETYPVVNVREKASPSGGIIPRDWCSEAGPLVVVSPGEPLAARRAKRQRGHDDPAIPETATGSR